MSTEKTKPEPKPGQDRIRRVCAMVGPLEGVRIRLSAVAFIAAFRVWGCRLHEDWGLGYRV